jgi:uncharacterized protein YdaL
MPKIKLTQSFIDNLKPSKETTVYRDENLPGFGVKITPFGTKTYIIQRRLRFKTVNISFHSQERILSSFKRHEIERER